MTTTWWDAARLCAAMELLPAHPRDLSYALELAGSVDSLFSPQIHGTSRAAVLGKYLAQELDARRVALWHDRLLALEGKSRGVQFVSVVDSAYAPILRLAYDRPPFYFLRGRIPTSPGVAIVGSRSAGVGELNIASSVAEGLVAGGFHIVSGLAVGIDTAAHRACLTASGETLAVLPNGAGTAVYPAENSDLANQVQESGGLVSQFRPGSPPTSSSFVHRNALISGFSAVSVVVAATERSGSRSEMDAALAQDRPVILFEGLVEGSAWLRSLSEREEKVHVVSSVESAVGVITRLMDQSGIA